MSNYKSATSRGRAKDTSQESYIFKGTGSSQELHFDSLVLCHIYELHDFTRYTLESLKYFSARWSLKMEMLSIFPKGIGTGDFPITQFCIQPLASPKSGGIKSTEDPLLTFQYCIEGESKEHL